MVKSGAVLQSDADSVDNLNSTTGVSGSDMLTVVFPSAYPLNSIEPPLCVTVCTILATSSSASVSVDNVTVTVSPVFQLVESNVTGDVTVMSGSVHGCPLTCAGVTASTAIETVTSDVGSALRVSVYVPVVVPDSGSVRDNVVLPDTMAVSSSSTLTVTSTGSSAAYSVASEAVCVIVASSSAASASDATVTVTV